MKNNNTIFRGSDCLNQEILKGYIEGNLNQEQMHEVEMHLVDCELCSEALEGLTILKKNYNYDETIKNFTIDINKHISLNRRRLNYYWIAAAASVIIIFTVSVFVYFNRMNDENTVLSDNSLNAKKISENASGYPKPEYINDSVRITEKPKSIHENVFYEKQKTNQVSSTAFNGTSGLTLSEAESEKSIEKNTLGEKVLNNKSETIKTEALFDDALNVGYTAIPSAGDVEKNEDISKSILSKDDLPEDKSVSKSKYIKRQGEKEMLNESASVASQKKSADSIVVTAQMYLDNAMKKFNSGDYKAALNILIQSLAYFPDNYELQYYYALSCFYTNDYFTSLKYFNKVLMLPKGRYVEQALWYKALCYIQQSETDKAKIIFNEIVNKNGIYKTQALEQLKQLK